MPRKKKTTLKGSDPAYTSDFSQPLPTNKLDEKLGEIPPSKPIEAPKAKAVIPATKPKTEPKPKEPTAQKAVPKPASKKAPVIAAVERKPDISAKRETALAAAVKLEQNDKLIALEAKGISAKDAITIAGRRAVEQFEPKPEYVEKPDADRMPMRQGYKSSKRISAAMLDKLRKKHDPLELSSDSAMMRGQFEPLFWSCLDAVIEELNSKY